MSDAFQYSRRGNSIHNWRQAADLVDAINTGKRCWAWTGQTVVIVLLAVLPLCVEK